MILVLWLGIVLEQNYMFKAETRTSILESVFLSLVILLRWCGSNIGGVTVQLSDFKWIAIYETDLYTCEVTGLNS